MVVKLWLFNTAIVMYFVLIVSAKAKAVLAYHVCVSSKQPLFMLISNVFITVPPRNKRTCLDLLSCITTSPYWVAFSFSSAFGLALGVMRRTISVILVTWSAVKPKEEPSFLRWL